MDPAEDPAEASAHSYVYAIGDAEHRRVKIGYTNDPRRRLRNIRVTCPFAVSILWQAEGGVTLEDALHGYFADYHSFGEWFEFPAGQNAVELISQAVEAIARGVLKLCEPSAEVLCEAAEPLETASCDVELPPDESIEGDYGQFYFPDSRYARLASARVAATRRELGLNLEDFTKLIIEATDWDVLPESVAAWEDDITPPGDVVLACASMWIAWARPSGVSTMTAANINIWTGASAA